jgi:predicted nuclease of predicted toxin-antitoxin system
VAAFFLDHNVSLRVAEFLRQRGHTARTAREMRLEGVGDEEILLTAATREWTVVTHNTKDFRLLHDAWHRWSGA